MRWYCGPLFLTFLLGCTATKPKPMPTTAERSAGPAATPLAPARPTLPDGGSTVEPSPETLPPNVRITIRAQPAKPKLKVYWGKKLLGETPYIMERPRDSGPADLVIQGDGIFPVHVRAYTYKNDLIMVRPTKLEDRMKLLGAREEPPPPDASPSAPPLDGGVPDGAR